MPTDAGSRDPHSVDAGSLDARSVDAPPTGPREWRMLSFAVPGAETGGNPAGVVLDPPADLEPGQRVNPQTNN